MRQIILKLTDLLQKLNAGTGLHNHHFPQGAIGTTHIPGYNYESGPAVALPSDVHKMLKNLQGDALQNIAPGGVLDVKAVLTIMANEARIFQKYGMTNEQVRQLYDNVRRNQALNDALFVPPYFR